MRYVSNDFKAIQNELIRPPLKVWFEVGTEIANVMNGGEDLDFDTTVAPVVPPKICTNTHFYAVVGDQVGVDNPNRICAPDNSSGTFSEPDMSVPYGVTPYTSANTEALIGDSTDYYNNFVGFDSPVTLSFKGGYLPDEIRIQRYDSDTDTWVDEEIKTRSGVHEEITFTPSDYEQAGDFRRFYVKNSYESGRFQFNWIRRDSRKRVPAHPTIIFTSDDITSVNVNQETDLTSQTLPSFSMDVECIDYDGIYTPDSGYWNNQFQDGTPCFLKIGYVIDGGIYYVPFMYGKLTQAPTYEEGKLKFSVEVELRSKQAIDFISMPNRTLNTGDPCDNSKFKDIIYLNDLFDDYSEAFSGADDENDSVCNYFGEVSGDDARQLVANALGCYITVGINKVNLYNTSNLQYKTPIDSLTRNEQVQNTLESQPKVGKIVVQRNANLVSSNYTRIEIGNRYYVRVGELTYIPYKVPFFEISKFVVNDYQKSVPDAVLQAQYSFLEESLNDDGTATVMVAFESDRNTYIQPIVSFYRVDNTQFPETDITDGEAGETYDNDNKLVTNEYISGKVKSVAHLINDIPNQYEVDVIQNYCYEVGDIIRLETQKNVYKTCVITGLNFVMPGSKGHVACRKIFSFLDCPQAVFDAVGVVFDSVYHSDPQKVTILDTAEGCIIAGIMHNVVGGDREPFYIGQSLLYILDATKVRHQYMIYNYVTSVNHFYTDLNGREWGYYVYELDPDTPLTTNVPVIELPEYDESITGDVDAYAITNILREVYSAQGMTAPADYTCTTHEITP